MSDAAGPVDAFTAVARSRRWDTSAGARGQCSVAAHEFTRLEPTATMLACTRSRFGFADHVVVQLAGGRILDWTYRQFAPDSPFPFIHDATILGVLWDDVDPMPTSADDALAAMLGPLR